MEKMQKKQEQEKKGADKKNELDDLNIGVGHQEINSQISSLN